MEATDRIEVFKDFFDQGYRAIIFENARIGNCFIKLDFQELGKFNVDLAEDLMDDPEEVIKAAQIAIEQFDIPEDKKKFQIQVKNIPKESLKLISEKRAKNLGKLLAFEGVIRSKSVVLPRKIGMRFECPSCGQVIPVLQLDRKVSEPNGCPCGRKSKFRRISKELVNIQKLELEELPENVKGTSQPQRLKVTLKEHLVDPKYEIKFNPGARVQIIGILQELPIQLRNGAESVDSDYIFDAVHIENIEEEEVDLNINPDEQKLIEQIANRDNYFDILRDSLVPSIYGHDKIKEGILIQLVGGVRKIADDGIVKRGDIHILMIGDPGSGKSAMLQRIENLIPHARVANGKGASGVGLTAAVVRDDFIGWTFQAGTLVLAHKSIAIIDEFDKMGGEDRDQIHEALEQQTVTVSKAGVQARLNCECSLIAGANPKYGRFDPYSKSIGEQIGLPPTIINRFDLIYPVRDIPDEDHDELLGNKICNIHSNEASTCSAMDTKLLRKYLNLAKTYKPMLTPAASKVLIEYWKRIRNSSKSTDGTVKSVPISARQLEGLIRLSEGWAKLRLSNKVESKDAEKAIDTMDYCLRQIAFDEETGTIDTDRIATGVSTSQRTNASIIRKCLDELENEIGKVVPLDDLVNRAIEKGLSDDKIESAIEYVKKMGEIHEPKRGFVSKLQ